MPSAALGVSGEVTRASALDPTRADFSRKNIEYQQTFGRITTRRTKQNLAKTFYCICMGVY